METHTWQPKIRGWWNIEVEAYKLIYDAANKRLEDLVSETISTTEKSQKILIFNLALASFFITFISSKQFNNGFIILLTILCAITFFLNIYFIYNLLTTKNVYRLGLQPKISFRDDLDSNDSKEGVDDGNLNNQLQLTYYNAICIIQNSIENQRQVNEDRVQDFNRATFFSAIFLILASICVALALRVSA